MRLLGVLVAMMLFTACENADPEALADSVTHIDSAGVAIVVSTAPTGAITDWMIEPEPQTRIGVQDGEESYQLFRVSGARTLLDGRILISNSGTHEIRLYSQEGSFLFAFGSLGQGPGEFARFSSMRPLPFSGDSLAVTDGGNGRVNVFDLRGTLGRTVPLSGGNRFGNVSVFGRAETGGWLAVAAVGSGILQGARGDRIDMDYALLLVQSAGDSTSVITVQPSRPRIVNEFAGVTNFPFVPFTSGPIQATDGRSLLLSPGGRSEVHRYSTAGELQAIYRWQAPQRPVGDIWSRYEEVSLAEISGENRRAQYAHFFRQDLPLPEILPSVQGLLVDWDGNIWAERYRLPWEEEILWDVLAPDGVWLGSVRTPPQLRVMEIGEDHVLGLARDELGIERVLKHVLHRSP